MADILYCSDMKKISFASLRFTYLGAMHFKVSCVIV